MGWWEERRRRRNEPFNIEDGHIRARLELEGLGVIKIENNLAFTIGDDGYRVVYPYFCEDPTMTPNIARLGLWAMARALPSIAIQNMRILDVLRATSFSVIEAPQRGSEESDFRAEYRRVIERWNELREEY